MANLTERQLIELAAARIFSDDWITDRQREIRRNIDLCSPAFRWDTRTGHEHRPTVQNVSVKLPGWIFDDDTPANFVAEDPISFFGIKEDV